MKLLRNPVFLVAITLFAITHFFHFSGSLGGFINSYADDLVCFPLIFTGILAYHRFIRLHDVGYILPVSHLLLGVVFYGILFEMILPSLHTGGTADPLDVLAYGTGALFFQIFINVA